MTFGLGDKITVKNVYGEMISGEIVKIYMNTVLVWSETTSHLVCKKEIYKKGDSLDRVSDPIIGKGEFTISKFKSV